METDTSFCMMVDQFSSHTHVGDIKKTSQAQKLFDDYNSHWHVPNFFQNEVKWIYSDCGGKYKLGIVLIYRDTTPD